jgi:H+/gluconate symporter-like permease
VAPPDTPVSFESAVKAENVPVFGKTPLAAPRDFGSWALLDLLIPLVGILTAIVLAIAALKRRKDADDEEMRIVNEETDTENENVRRVSKTWLFLSIVLALIGVILFFLTQDTRLPLVLMDKWTVVFAGILCMELIGVRLTFRKKSENDEDTFINA